MFILQGRIAFRPDMERYRYRYLAGSPHSRVFTSVLVNFRPRSFLFTSATVRIRVQTTPKCGTEFIQYDALVSRSARRSFARHRNRAEVTVLMCEQIFPIRYVFRKGTRAIRRVGA